MLEKFTYLPAKLGSSLVHSSRQASRYSSVTAPRSSNGSVPIASNSSRHQPAPTPSVSRPSDSTSIVARIFAVSTAGRCGTTMTAVTSRSFEVLAATKGAAVNRSGAAGTLAGVRIRVFVFKLARDDDMVAQRAVIVAELFALLRNARQILGARKRAADRRTKAPLHERSSGKLSWGDSLEPAPEDG